MKFLHLGFFLLFLCFITFSILALCLDIPTFHIDGAFQTASGLYRLDSGQFPGKDFYPYLGVGPLFVLYPFFKIAGANMMASGFASHFCISLCAVFLISFIWHLVWRSQSFWTSLIVAICLFLVYMLLSRTGTHALPGASLRPLRSFLPYAIFAIYYFFIMNINPVVKRYIFSGILAGLALLWSNDYAIPTAGLFTVFVVFQHQFCWKNIILYCLAFCVSVFVFMNLATLGHPLDILRYNLDVAHDQWWYFAHYDKDHRILEFLDLTKLFKRRFIVGMSVLVCLGFYTFKHRTIEYVILVWIGLILCAGGVLASVGGHVGHYYFEAFRYWGVMVIAITILRVIWTKSGFVLRPKMQIILLCLLAACMLSLSVFSIYSFQNEKEVAENDPKRFFVPELGGYLNTEWKSYVEFARETREKNIIEEYWGILSAIQKHHSKWPVDSVIHALGKTREICLNKLPEADFIVSSNRLVSEWQSWSLSQNYWFYEVLLKSWKPILFSPTTIVWQKLEHPRYFESVSCTGGETIKFDAPQSGLYEIDMNYAFEGNSRSLIMVQNNISIPYKRNHVGYISIDPTGNKIKFPVYVSSPGIIDLDVNVLTKARFNFVVKSCRAGYVSDFLTDLSLSGVVYE